MTWFDSSHVPEGACVHLEGFVVFGTTEFVFFFTLLVVALSAHLTKADLYADGVLSTDWLVDSSDEIHRVRFVALDKGHGLMAEPLDLLKPQAKKAVREDYLKTLRVPMSAKPSEEWLLFLRRNDSSDLRLIRGINLTRPLASYHSAAFTREGTPLQNHKTILNTIETRVHLKRILPLRCDRDAVDKMIGTEGRFQVHNRTIRGYADMELFGLPAPLDRYLGGVLIAIDCWHWDQDGPNDCDTWVHRMVVPVESEDRSPLFEAARLIKQRRDTPRYFDPICELVNFPGKETESLLKEIIAKEKKKTAVNYTERRRNAEYVLHYLLFCHEATDPLNETLVGKWQLEDPCMIDATFEKDNTYTATEYFVANDANGQTLIPKRQGRLNGYSKGHWVVRKGRLTIYRTHHRTCSTGDWVPWSYDVFMQEPIIKVTANVVVLEDGKLMKRK